MLQSYKLNSKSLIYIVSCLILFVACSKGGESPTPPAPPPPPPPPPPNACATKNITVTATATPSASCGTGTGSITITAAGSTGFTYSIDGGAFQTSNVFTNVTAGNHTIQAKDNDACTGTGAVTVPATAAGALFTDVKTMMSANCFSCHGAGRVEGGVDFTIDCNIVTLSARIKARAVDGNPSFMPEGGQLSAADKKKITDWIAAGARHSD